MTKRKKPLSTILLGAILALGVGLSLAQHSSMGVRAASTAATMTAGTNGSAAKVNNKDAIKVGTSKAGGDMKVTVGAGAVKLSFYAAAWNGVTGLSINLTGATAGTASFALTADSGVANNSPFTLSGNESSYYFETTLSGITASTDITLTTSTTKRFVIWEASYDTSGGGGGDPTPATQVNVTAAGGATTVKTGKTLQLSAAVIPAGADQTVTWSSSNNSYATVNSNSGLVTGVAAGNVVITATSTTEGIKGTISLIVETVIVGSEETIVLTNVGTGTSDSTTVKQTTVNDYVLNYKKGKEQKSGTELSMFLAKDAGAFVGNKTPIPGPIQSVTILTGSGASSSTSYYVHFATTEFSAAGSGGTAQVVAKATSKTFDNTSVADATFFAISLGNSNNGQVANITIVYEVPPTKALDSIAVTTSPSKTSYFTGDIFDGTGMVVKAYFDDGSSETIAPVLPTTPLAAGQTNVQISYTFGGVTETTTVPVTVSNRSIIGIEVTTNPSKMTYRIGDVFDPTGMVVKATYDLGPAVDNYTNYMFLPDRAFDTVGEQAMAIISTDDPSVTTLLDINILEALAEGTYTITTNSNTYANPLVVSGLDINKSESSMGDLSISDIDNVRLNSQPNDTGTITIGGNNTTGGKFTITLPTGMVATAVTFNDLIVDSEKTPTLTINGGVSFTHSGKTNETLHPFARALEISTVGTSRIWTSSIEIKAAFNAAGAAQSFGALFTEKTSEECAKVYGKDGNTFKVSIWNEMKLIYDHADEAVQDSIKLGEPDVEGNDLEKAIATYVYIVNKYKYVDFIGIVNPSGTKDVLFEMNENNTIMLIVIVSLISVTALGGVFYFRKKEQN